MPQKTLRVKSRFEASENISSTARKIEKNTRRLNRTMKRGFRESSKSALKFKTVLKSILAASVITKGFGLLGQGIQKVTGQFIGFDDAITAAAVRFKDIGPDAKNFNQQLKIIKGSARAAGQATIFTAEQAAVALDFLARAGFTSVEAMGSLNSMINLSIASGEDFAQVADFSSDLLGSFGLAAKDSGQKIANLNRLNDVLVKTVNSANVKVEDLFETMTQVGPVATGVLGSSLEEAASFAAILGNSGIKSSQAMTALKNIFLRLAAPASAGEKTLKALGLTLDDGTGKAKGMTAFMEEMGEKLKGFGQIDQAKILDAVFGKRAIAGAKIIFNNIEAVKDFRKELDNAGGTSKKTADIMQTSLGNRIKGLGSALTELGFKVLDPFETKIKSSIVSLTEFFRARDAKPLTDSLLTVLDVAEKVLKTFNKLTDKKNVEESKKIAESFDAWVFSFKNLGEEGKKQPVLFGGGETIVTEQLRNLESIDKKFKQVLKDLFIPSKEASAVNLSRFGEFKEKRDFSKEGIVPFIASKLFPEFAAQRTEEMNKAIVKANINPEIDTKPNIQLLKPQVQPVVEPVQKPLKPEPLKPQPLEPQPLKPEPLKPNIQPLEPQIEVPNINQQLNVKVENNIKGNDVEVETIVDAPETSGGQGMNKI